MPSLPQDTLVSKLRKRHMPETHASYAQGQDKIDINRSDHLLQHSAEKLKSQKKKKKKKKKRDKS
jgi:hypothetical protein